MKLIKVDVKLTGQFEQECGDNEDDFNNSTKFLKKIQQSKIYQSKKRNLVGYVAMELRKKGYHNET